MMKQCLRLLLLGCAPTWFGCATILHGTTQNVRFESIPPQATVRVGTQTITTPGELTLTRQTGHHVDFEKPGYLPAHSFIGQTSSGAVWGNVLFGGIIGLIVDHSTGGAYELDPTMVSVTLLPDPSSEGNAADANSPRAPPEPASSASDSRKPEQPDGTP